MTDEEELVQEHKAIFIAENQAKMIWQDNKTIIILSKEYNDVTDKLFYVVGGNEAYAVVKITEVNMIDLDEFEKLQEHHMITNQERELWWSGKQKLFAYKFNMIKKFDAPELVACPDDSMFSISEASFITDLVMKEKKLSESMTTYDASIVSLEELKDDFKIVLLWIDNKAKGIELPFSLEEIKLLTKKIVNELILRENISFELEAMSEDCRSLVQEILSERVTVQQKNEDVVPLTDIVVFQDVVSLLGDFPSTKMASIDMSLRLSKSLDLQKLLEEKILNYSKNNETSINIIPSDGRSLNDSYVPIYDLVLRRKSDLVKVTKTTDLKLFERIQPMYPSRTFTDKRELLDYMFG